MKARSIIGNASFGPDTLKVLYQAFDDAWASVAGNFGARRLERLARRLERTCLGDEGAAIGTIVGEIRRASDIAHGGIVRRVQDLGK